MKPKTVILMVIAVVCGLGASYMTSKYLSAQNKQKVEPKVKVVVAKVEVPRYRKIKEPQKWFTVKAIPKSAAPRKYFSDLKQLKDKALSRPLNPDQHVTQADILMGRLQPLVIPDGKNAIALNVNAASVVSGWVYPGDHVDFILTTYSGQATALTILRRVLVLAVGAAAERAQDNQTGRPIQARTVTVAVDSHDAGILRLAEKKGQLSLVLRPYDSKDVEPVKPVTEKDLFASARNTDDKQRDDEPKEDKRPVQTIPPVKEEKDPSKEEVVPQPEYITKSIKADWKIEIGSGLKTKPVYLFKSEEGNGFEPDNRSVRTWEEKVKQDAQKGSNTTVKETPKASDSKKESETNENENESEAKKSNKPARIE